MSENDVSFKRLVEISEAVSYLEALAMSLRTGRIVVEHGETALDLDPPPVVTLEIEAKQRKDKAKFGFEIKWKNTPNKDSDKSLTISSGSKSDSGDLPPAA
jgi:amphi-Trp domain-containing protein